jgi:hypothetical protein
MFTYITYRVLKGYRVSSLCYELAILCDIVIVIGLIHKIW